MIAATESKSDRVRVLLQTTSHDTQQIVDLVGCSPELVRKCRQALRMPHDRESMKAVLSRLQGEIQDLKRNNAVLTRRLEKLDAHVFAADSRVPKVYDVRPAEQGQYGAQKN